jgi:UDP-2,3-diacylglucosamine pyrophosphatase LpxH
LRTLVVSDLHLGSRLGRDVLGRPQALAALLAALDGVHRLVLLGDVVELLAERGGYSVALAEPVLRAIGTAMGAEREIVVVPGNHDARLVRPWLHANGVGPAVDASIPLDATPLLALVTSWLAPARVRVHYPGVWLSSRVWATHGHYLDRHLLPDSAFGIARGLLGRLPRDGATPADYEQRGRPSVTTVEAWLTRLPRPLAALAEDLAELVRAATMPSAPLRFLSRRHAGLTSRVLSLQMRRASIPALARVVHRLGVDADWVVFGHVHRCGPLAGDDAARWTGPGGRPRIANTGSWVYEPLLVHRVKAPHPYWPGGAVVITDDEDPRAIGLLDDVDGLVGP